MGRLALKLKKGHHISKCSAILEVYNNYVMLLRAEKSKMASKMAAVIEILVCEKIIILVLNLKQ